MISDEFVTFHRPSEWNSNKNIESTSKPEKEKDRSPISGSTFLGEYSPKNSSKPETNNHSVLSEAVSSNELLFFNYHEFTVTKYKSLDTNEYKKQVHPVIVTHFPNPYADPQSVRYISTRVVRVPRSFEVNGNRYPQFSHTMPGFEKAALIDPNESTSDFSNIGKFTPKGEYKGQLFGYSSVSPLSNYLGQQEFEQIIEKVNEHLKNAYDPLRMANLVSGVFNFVTMWAFEALIKSYSVQALDQLEKYVEEVNNELEEKGVRMMNPVQSGLVSLDFEIPKPVVG